MRLYPKKLDSLKDLEQEKRKLQKQLQKLDEEELFSMGSILGRNKSEGSESAAGGFDLSSLLSFLPISNPVFSMLIPVIQNRLFNKSGKEKKDKNDPNSTANKAKKIAKTVAIDIVTSYLKWKAIELSYKGTKYLLKKRKEKKESKDNKEATL